MGGADDFGIERNKIAGSLFLLLVLVTVCAYRHAPCTEYSPTFKIHLGEM